MPKKQDQDVEKRWAERGEKLLVGRKIVKVRYMSVEEANDLGWWSRPLVLEMDDGSTVYAMRDDEGNDGGALAMTSSKGELTFPVLRPR